MCSLLDRSINGHWHIYKERHLVRQYKWIHSIVTGYDKPDAFFLSFVYIASIMFW